MRGRHQARSALPRLQRVDVRKCRAAERREAVLPLACDNLRALRWYYKGDAWCCVSSRSVHAGADPLREGGVFCAKHALPPAEHCASCGETDTELWPDEDTEPQYFKQFHSYERLHYCAACWDGWSE